MIVEVRQNTATGIRVLMRSAASGQGLIGLASLMAVRICKAGLTSFSVITPVITDLGNGVYNIALTGTDASTLGYAPLNITAPNALENNDVILYVIPATLGDVKADTGTILTASAATLTLADQLRKAAYGRWKIENDQLTIYDDDGTTPLEVFDLKDADGNPSMVSIFERTPVP